MVNFLAMSSNLLVEVSRGDVQQHVGVAVLPLRVHRCVNAATSQPFRFLVLRLFQVKRRELLEKKKAQGGKEESVASSGEASIKPGAGSSGKVRRRKRKA